MGLISPDVPVSGEQDSTAESKVSNALREILALVNGGLDQANIRDGSITTAKLAFTLQAAFIPPGIILPTGGTDADSGFLLCDGTAVSRTTYSALFGRINTRWGAGDGVTTFNLPNLNGPNRTLVGTDGSAPSANTGYAVGATGGEKTHVLTLAETPDGKATFVTASAVGGSAFTIGPGGGHITQDNAGGTFGPMNVELDLPGSNGAHNNMQPYAAVTLQIKT